MTSSKRSSPCTVARRLAGRQLQRAAAVEQLEDALRRAGRAHEVAPQRAQRAQRHRHDPGVEQERGELAHGERAARHQLAAVPDHQRDRAVADEADDAAEAADHDRLLGGQPEALVDRLAVARHLLLFARERADGADARDHLVRHRGGGGERVLHLGGELAELLAVGERDHHADRHDRHRHRGHARAHPRQERDAADRAQRVAQRHRDVHRHRVLQHRGVGGEAVGELAGAALIEELDVLVEDRGEEARAQVGHDALAGHGEEPGAQHGEDRLHREQHDQEDRAGVEVDRRRARHQGVDHVADRLRVEQSDARAHQQRHRGDGEARELGRASATMRRSCTPAPGRRLRFGAAVAWGSAGAFIDSIPRSS